MTASHPLRVRGLKLLGMPSLISERVASFTGAWIETVVIGHVEVVTVVASFTGAWIET